MCFTVLFLVFGAALVAAWIGHQRSSLVLFAIGILAAFPLYLYHATTLLPLSF